ncbi:uncharacterized protein BDR25DRAFT_395464 [Lindgomyces ingoldianus]|uniref:Uncharacterized protein n=1 Tax=Lindgomyces ingoldianus TaxID=673940 RepID=A0ACB6QLA6_9PLEO|nr:uncharacterized protein BDR25DRAFT_395464 [Lindgomyces ingoldianus]KAF2466911.1 hypothetical protein BDR25DRAFT_395464 [Lindgomyces ingoldianus]
MSFIDNDLLSTHKVFAGWNRLRDCELDTVLLPRSLIGTQCQVDNGQILRFFFIAGLVGGYPRPARGVVIGFQSITLGFHLSGSSNIHFPCISTFAGILDASIEYQFVLVSHSQLVFKKSRNQIPSLQCCIYFVQTIRFSLLLNILKFWKNDAKEAAPGQQPKVERKVDRMLDLHKQPTKLVFGMEVSLAYPDSQLAIRTLNCNDTSRLWQGLHDEFSRLRYIVPNQLASVIIAASYFLLKDHL